jgi:DNA-directed RNA polymerase specialized sigma24 family protein
VIKHQLWTHRFAAEFMTDRRYRELLLHVEPEDVDQTAFLGSVKASRTWSESKGAFTGWSWYWMRKELFTLLRGRESREAPVDRIILESHYPGPDEEAEAREHAEIVSGIMAVLPAARVVALEDWARGEPIRETAARLGITRKATEALRSAALTELWGRLEGGNDHGRVQGAESPSVGGSLPGDQRGYRHGGGGGDPGDGGPTPGA